MFDFEKKDVEKKIRDNAENRKMMSGLMDMISEMILASDAPESKKSQIRLVNASRELETLIHETAVKYSLADEPNVEIGQKLCFLYATMTAQINAIAQEMESGNA